MSSIYNTNLCAMRRSFIREAALPWSRILSSIVLMGLATRVMAQTTLLDCHYNNEWRKDSTGLPVRYHYVWSDTTNSGFSQLGTIITEAGGSIGTLCQTPTLQSLRRGDIYIIVDPDTPQENPSPYYVQSTDADAIAEWVKEGGILVLLGNDKGNAEFEHFNMLAERFGIHFNEVSRNRVKGNDFVAGTFDSLPTHPLFQGVAKIFLKEICTLHLIPPAEPILRSTGDTIMAASKFGKGFVFAVGDPWLYNEYMDQRRLPPDYGNALAARNLFGWLLGRVRTAEKK
jgi:unsaturated rhamnogalacturonyl hydrolase